MAKKKKEDDDAFNKVLWVAGAAGVTAFAMFYVNKHLNEKEELNRLRSNGHQPQLSGGDGEE